MFKKIFLGLVLLVTIAVIPPLWYLFDLPDTAQLRTTNPTTSAIRTFREEQTIQKGGKPHSYMEWRSLSEISSHLVHAVVLSEDDTFYQHEGFDMAMLKQAARTNWERKRFAFGASTITQQLARTLYLSSHKNLLRKAKEALITRRLEKDLSKPRILELYLNVVEWGPNVYGAEAASQTFFNKPAIELAADEAVALAAILPSPRRWSPTRDTKFMARRKATLTDRMIRANYIPPNESSDSVTTPIEDESLAAEEQAEEETNQNPPEEPVKESSLDGKN